VEVVRKPEKLIERILEASSEEGDLILDFFGGSGTTLAVAHKMKRQYIGIEQMDDQMNIIVDRLCKVISGEDNKGISKQVNWQSGGSFVYCELKENAQDLITAITKIN
jgi:adenine-specific DNA-methyltransferase